MGGGVPPPFFLFFDSATFWIVLLGLIQRAYLLRLEKMPMKQHVPRPSDEMLYTIPPFESVTKKFFNSKASKQIACPRCGATLDFQESVQWQGPEHFVCSKCDKLLSVNLILKAMNDLGVK